jgi:hypothetical protein
MFNLKDDKVAAQDSLPFSSAPSASSVGCATRAPLFRAMPRYQA